MYTNMKRGLLWLVAPLAFALASCSSDGSTLGLGTEGDFNVGYLDTVTVRTSTVMLDSLPTSGTGTLMVGRYSDPKLGVTESQIFMEMSNGTGWSQPSSKATFDSMVLILPYAGYYYGDTTGTTELHVYQASKAFTTYPLPLFWQYEGRRPYFITSPSGYFFNSSHVDYTTELGTIAFKPRPQGKDSIHIRLPDALGKAWLEEAKKETNYFASLTTFLERFRGITVKATSGSSIVGITGASVKIRLYYKDRVSELVTQLKYELPYSSTSFVFNRITADRTGTLLENLGPAKKIIYSKDTDNETYIQSGLGVLTKIEFPHIESLLEIEGMMAVNDATLTIEPVKKTFPVTTPIPPTLVLFRTDKSNQPLVALTHDYTTEAQSANIGFDNEFGTNSGYTFHITEYVLALMKSPQARANGTALLLSTPLTNFLNTVNRATLGGGEHPEYRMRLKIYYTYKK